jgi:beta-glucosidase
LDEREVGSQWQSKSKIKTKRQEGKVNIKQLRYILVIFLVYLALMEMLSLYMKHRQMTPPLSEMTNETRHFPENFLWGSATAAHQVEGDNTNNNWFLFENAKDADGNPKIHKNQKAGDAADHWNRYRDDIKLMQSLGLNSYRFSVEWSKIEPRPGHFDISVLKHYQGMVKALLQAGIEPVITLHHFTDPIWFTDKGGWLQEEPWNDFLPFVRTTADFLGEDIRIWCTFNEPSVYAVNGWFTGEFPPGKNNAQEAALVLQNMLLTHAYSYKLIKEKLPQAQVGLVKYIQIFDPANARNPFDVLATLLLDRNFNHSVLAFLKSGNYSFNFPGLATQKHKGDLGESFDFIGLNYYTRSFRSFKPGAANPIAEIIKNKREERTDMNWEIYPEGLYRALKMVKSYTEKPIYITENGIADNSDTKRENYIRHHLAAVNYAIGEGIDIRGYFYWSLLDNFEWAHGFDKRFGLYKVNFQTQQRILRKGSRAYTEIIQNKKP